MSEIQSLPAPDADEVPNDELVEMPNIINNYGDSTSSLTPNIEEPTLSKSKTSSLGKMFQKMRLSEVRAKLKKEGGKSSMDLGKTDSVTEPEFSKSESIDGFVKKGAIEKASVHSSGAVSNKGIRNYLGSWNACWQKSANSDDVSETEYGSPEVTNEQIISPTTTDIPADDSLSEVPLRPMTPVTEVEQLQ